MRAAEQTNKHSRGGKDLLTSSGQRFLFVVVLLPTWVVQSVTQYGTAVGVAEPVCGCVFALLVDAEFRGAKGRMCQGGGESAGGWRGLAGGAGHVTWARLGEAGGEKGTEGGEMGWDGMG